MNTFNRPIALRMEAGGLDPQDTEDRADLRPNGGRELSSVVRGEQSWHSKSRDPGREKSSNTGFHIDGSQLSHHKPESRPVHHSQKIRESLTGG